MNYANAYLPTQHITGAAILSGGTCWLIRARWQDVATWPVINPATGMAATAITLKTGATWYQLELVRHDRLFTEAPQPTKAGIVYTQTITGWLPGNNVNAITAMHTSQYNRYVYLLKDKSGQVRLVGHPHKGAQQLLTYTTGNDEEERKRTVNIQLQSSHPAIIYTGTLPSINDQPLEPPSELSRYFSDGFDDGFS